MTKHIALFLALSLGLSAGAAQDPAPEQDEAKELLVGTLAQSGVRLDFEHGAVSFRARVLVRNDLLEYLLVHSNGAAHESMLVTEVQPSVLNTALLALGVEPGENARWTLSENLEDPDRRGGQDDFEVEPPKGDGFYLYAAWREGDEVYFHRADDLIANLETGRSMRRHRWVFLGSRFHVLREGEPEVFLADLEGNLINVSFFYQGNTLLTGSLPECIRQTVWVPNAWLLPPFEAEIEFILARERLERLPDAWRARLPVVVDPAAGGEEGNGR